MESAVMKHLTVLLSVWWLRGINGKAVGHVIPQQPPLQLKTDNNNVATKSETIGRLTNGSGSTDHALSPINSSANSECITNFRLMLYYAIQYLLLSIIKKTL